MAVSAAVALVSSLAACSRGNEVIVLETTVLSWPGEAGRTLGQVIVRVRNDADQLMDPDVLGRGRQTAARLVDDAGADIAGGDARVQLHAAPAILEPGEEGFLIGSFELDEAADAPDDARIEVNADDADEPPPVDVVGFTLTDGSAGVGAEGELAWDGSGTAVVRAIALDADGAPLGYAATDEVRYSPGRFEMCCFPPTVTPDVIGDVVVYGLQARDDG